MKKKVLSFLMAMMLVFSVIGTLPTNAAANHSGNLSLYGSEIRDMIEHLTNSKVIYFKGDAGLDAVPTVDGDWDNYRYYAADDASGIYLNDVKQTDRSLVKYNKTNNFWFVDGWDKMEAGAKIVIKGTFVNTAGDVAVTIPEYTFSWDGSHYVEPRKTADKANVDAQVREDSTATGLFITTYENGAVIDDGMTDIGWGSTYYPMVTENSGVYHNNQWTHTYLRKVDANTYYVCIGDKGITATNGTVITLQGQFTSGGKIVEFNKHKFTFDGSKWTGEKVIDGDYVYNNVAISSVHEATSLSPNGTAWYVYYNITGVLPGEPWQVLYKDVKVLVDDTEITTSVLAKKADAQLFFMELPLSDVLKAKPTEGTRLTVKAGSYHGHYFADQTGVGADMGQGISFASDFTLEWNGSTWAVPQPKIDYTDVKVTGLSVSWNTEFNRYNMFLTTDKALPGTKWTGTFETPQVTINDRQVSLWEGFYKDTEETLFMYLPETLMSRTITKNTKIVVKAGKLLNTTIMKGINLTQDIVIYANQYGWSLEGYVEKPEEVALSFKGLNQATSYQESTSSWHFYLVPDKTVPGVADQSRFPGAAAKLNGKSILVDLFKSAHEGTVWFEVPSSVLPKNITKNMTLVIQKGSYIDEKTGAMLTIQKDFTLYGNQYGWSADGYVAPPKTTKVQFKGINTATKLNAFSGRWNLYLIPNKTLPGTADVTAYRYVTVTVDGKTEEVALIKASHEGTAFMDFSNSLVPQKITKNMKMTLKAGTLKGSDNKNNLVLEKDVVIYINQYGWSMDGYVKKPKTTTISLTGINQASGYKADSAMWHLYLTPDKTVPGTADKTIYLVNVAINGKTIPMEMYKASHEGTTFMMIPSTILPQTVTKDTKIVLKAGTYQGNDNKSAIKLTKDVTIYVNLYGWSMKGFVKKPTIKSKNVELTLDRESVYGGDKNGLYLSTTDKLPVDETWASSIFAASYDSKSGIYYNGKKIPAPIKRFYKGKMYVALVDAGITAKDKDKVTIKGLFALGEVGTTYKEVSFYFNGKTWNTKYEKAKPASYTKVTAKSLNGVSGWFEEGNLWRIYLDVKGTLPGSVDVTNFSTLTVEVNGKKIDTVVAHSYEGTLFVPVYAKDLAKNAKDGSKITIKAGKALSNDMTTGIQLTKDYTLYLYKGALSEVKPATDTKWLKTVVKGTNGAGYYNAEAKMWYLLFQFRKNPVTEHGTVYAQFPLTINGKDYTFTARQDNIYITVQVPDSIIPGNTMNNMKVELKNGAKTWANAGRNGIEIQGSWTGYVYNKLIQDKPMKKIKETKLNMVSVQHANSGINAWDVMVHHIYIKMDNAFPGKAWYQSYQDFEYYYNGKKIVTSLSKSESSDNLLGYFPIVEQVTGKAKDGDMVTVKAGTSVSAGDNKITFQSDYSLIYKDGVWSEYVKSDLKKAKKTASLWEDFRFEDGFVPAGTDDGSVTSTNETTYNTIYSTEMHKDYTMQFSMTKEYDDEITNPMTIILRGTPVDMDSKLDPSFLNGYVLTMTWDSIKNTNGEKVEQQTLHLWKNGKNDALVDVYRVNYVTLQEDHPLFKTGETYNYDISIWNVNASTVCIEVWINDRLITRYYDHAGTDVKDPVINEGTFAIAYGCPGYLTDTVDTSLAEVISSVDECVTGEEVQCAVTYPYVAKGTELSVDKEGATITNGVFKAEKAGTYTISGSYNGKKMADKTIVVKEAPVENAQADSTSNFPIWPVAGGIVVVALAVIAVLLLKKRGNKNDK